MPRKPVTIKHATRFLKKWVVLFGFGHYNITLAPLPDEAKGEVWGRSTYNHEEEWCIIEVVPDGVLPPAQVEALVLHELTHGLLELAQGSDTACESVCNRIARLALAKPDVKLCNEWNVTGQHGVWGTYSRFPFSEDWMKLLVEGLPLREKTVVNSLFYEARSLRATADAMGCSVRTVGRLRDTALLALSAAAEKLKNR